MTTADIAISARGLGKAYRLYPPGRNNLTGLISGRWWLFPVDHLTQKHYIHHAGNYDNNYASLTPLWDMLFGTRG